MASRLALRVKAPSSGQLSNPISVVRARRTPDADDGFNLVLTKQFDAWAMMDMAASRRSAKESEDGEEEVTHIFVIRRDHTLVAPETRDYVVSRGRLHRVLNVLELDQRAFFWVIETNDEGELVSFRFDNPATPANPNDPVAPAPEPAPPHSEFPFWEA